MDGEVIGRIFINKSILNIMFKGPVCLFLKLNKKQSKKPDMEVYSRRSWVRGNRWVGGLVLFDVTFPWKKRFFNVTFYIKRTFREWNWHKRSAQSWVGDCKLTGNEASARLKANEKRSWIENEISFQKVKVMKDDTIGTCKVGLEEIVSWRDKEMLQDRNFSFSSGTW